MKNETDTTYTFDDQTVSGLHKDVYGIRPSERFWTHWNESTMDEKQALWDGLNAKLEQILAEEAEAEIAAMATFDDRIQQLMVLGASNQTMAIHWILQSEDLEPTDYMSSDEAYAELEYRLDLPYRYVAGIIGPGLETV